MQCAWIACRFGWNDSRYIRLSDTYYVSPVNQTVHPSVSQSVLTSVNQTVHPSVSQSVHPSINQSVLTSVNQTVHPSVSQSVHPSINQSVLTSVSQFVHPSASQPVSTTILSVRPSHIVNTIQSKQSNWSSSNCAHMFSIKRGWSHCISRSETKS